MSYNPPVISDQAKKIAEKFFERAEQIAETRNYDYAIELYIQGLAKDPEAVEKGHKALREVAIKRKLSGGKPAGLIEQIKRKLGKKDPLEQMLDAEYLFAKDPFNISYAEAFIKAADKAELPEAVNWGVDVLFELVRARDNISSHHIMLIKDLSEKLGEYYDKTDQVEKAIKSYQRGVDVLELGLTKAKVRDYDLMSLQRDLAGKLAILRGKYEKAESFRESVRDMDRQYELMHEEQVKKSEETLDEMIEKARADLQRNPDEPGKINKLVDLLLERGRAEDEKEAIDLLMDAYSRTNRYAYKMRADDIKIRQMTREIKELEEKGGQEEKIEQLKKRLDEFELKVYEERSREYPTDKKIRFEYGKRLFKAKRYDEAIPVFQDALIDPRYSVRSKYYIGVCFYNKGWYQQAIDILREAAEEYEIEGDSLCKDIYYLLGRALEDSGEIQEAIKTYSKIVRWDYNYRDVKSRLDNLQNKSKG